MNPLLTIVTATFNSEKTIKETIESVLSQSYTNFEYILVDGESSDKTVDIIKSYQSKFDKNNIPFFWISEKDTGIYNAWNKAMKMANGKWISFLGSDDIYLENALSKYASTIQNNPNCDFVYSKVRLMAKNKIIFEVSDQWNWNVFKRYMKIAHVGSFHNNHYFDKYGLFDEEFKISGDYEMLLRAKEKLNTIFIDEFTAEMKDGGISNKNVLRAFMEVRKAKIKTANSNVFIAFLDFYFSISKYYLSRIIK